MADWLAWVGVVGGVIGIAGGTYTALSARAIERYRAKLKAEGYEHEVRFARLHERRVDVIADLYSKLVDAEGAFASWVHPLQLTGEATMDEKGKRAADAGNEFVRTFVRSRIWLDEDLVDRIGALNKKLIETNVQFTTYRPDDPTTRREHLEAWKSAWDKVEKDVPPLRKEIEARFREMLGVIGSP